MDTQQILKSHKLRITDCRLQVLEFILNADHAVSSRDLEEKFEQFDRVTLYRTLHSFEENGVIHSIPNESGVARYGICHETCEPGHHTHSHAHFKCLKCGNIQCISDQKVPKVNLPGFVIQDYDLILSGMCESCSSS